MRLPCAKPLAFIVTGLSFLKPGLTNIQFDNMTLVATALVLGSGFNLSRISRMWLEDKVVSTLSYFLSDAKFYVPELQLLYAKRIQQVYDINEGNFLIDDTMKHHSKFCKWIHGVFVLFDHALGTNLKATCIVFFVLQRWWSYKISDSFPVLLQRNKQDALATGQKAPIQSQI